MAGLLIFAIAFTGCATCTSQGEVNGGGTIVGNLTTPMAPDGFNNDMLAKNSEEPIAVNQFLQDFSIQLVYLLKNSVQFNFILPTDIELNQHLMIKE